MLISLSMVYDREMGSMRILMVSPLPRWFLLTRSCSPESSSLVLQAYAFLVIALLWDIVRRGTAISRVAGVVPGGLMMGALGLLLSSRSAAPRIRQRDEFRHFSDVLCLSALYPLWRVKEEASGLLCL